MFKLPELSFEYNELEPHIDEATMKLHYGKHHAGYVAKLNEVLKGNDEFLEKNVEDLLREIDRVDESIKQKVVNFGGGHANHSLFWEIMSPNGGGEPGGKLMDSIKKSFGSFEKFKVKFSEKALGVFGSGWVFLIKDKEGKLKCKRHSFQNSPLSNENTPILTLDVWEHAYYLKYKNIRSDYVEAWWNVVNWKKVEQLFESSV